MTHLNPETPVVTLTVAALSTLIERVVVSALDARERRAPRLLSQTDAAKELGINPRTLANWESNGMPVFRPPGCVPRYDLDEIRAWMRGNAKAAE